eukprot:3500184-Prymnesium_polylepis.1
MEHCLKRRSVKQNADQHEHCHLTPVSKLDIGKWLAGSEPHFGWLAQSPIFQHSVLYCVRPVCTLRSYFRGRVIPRDYRKAVLRLSSTPVCAACALYTWLARQTQGSGVMNPNVPYVGGALFGWSKLPNMARSSLVSVGTVRDPFTTSQDDSYWCEHLPSQEMHPSEPY